MPARNKLLQLLMVFWLLIAIGCSASDGGDDTDTTDDTTTSDVTPAAVELVAANNSILLNGSTTISATVYDSAGAPIPNVAVFFSVDNPVLASISSPATTDGSGVATTTLTARDTPGNVTVSTSVSGAEGGSQSLEITITSTEMPASINLTATPATIEVQQTTTITAEVLDEDGNAIANGTAVTFSVDNDSLGAMSTSSATTVNGFATTTFEAASDAGTVTITAAAGDIQNEVSIDILQSAPQSLVFISATPQRIALAGTAGTTSSVVRFQVLDENGSPVNGINISLILEGPNGGEYLNSSSISSNLEGFADVILNAGTVSGPVTITGTITTGSGPFTTSSSVISIGGGVPSARRFAVATEILNLPGLAYFGRETDITAYLADRFGNFNILQGTTISFATEIGLSLLSSEVTLDENGVATVTARTQGSTTQDWPEDVLPLQWETDLQNYVWTTYGMNFTGHPRDGLCSVMVYTKGEEHFDDTNANGVYDLGETIVDTPIDPFIDFNDNQTYDGPSSADPEEIYVDSNSDGMWDDINGVWDSDKTIFTNFKILLTGGPNVGVTSTIPSYVIPDGGSATITFLICDRNINPLSPGTTISISKTGGGEMSPTSVSVNLADMTMANNMSAQLSMLEYPLAVYDDDIGDTDAPEVFTLDLKITWEGVEHRYSVSGTVD